MSQKDKKAQSARGAEIIRSYLKSLPKKPGVYRMLDEAGEALYVGKAKSLKDRVSSYASPASLSYRIQRMIALTASMEFVHTETEAEALLLESNLIKKLKPRYNILLRDSKSFPYILLTGDHDFPMITKHRGARKREGEYYGPFADVGSVNRTIAILQRAFLLRNCTDHNFAQRERPCLQYHIKRCTAPCVGHVDKETYAAQVLQARDFLEGKSAAVQKDFSQKMQEASDAQDYEAAAQYRDRLRALTSVQSRQDIHIKGLKNADIIGLVQDGGQSCVQVFFFRAGANYGNRSYFPRHDKEDTPAQILAAFLAQFYENKPVPKEIVLSHEPEDMALIEGALNLRGEDTGKIKISSPQKGARRRLVDFVLKNAQAALARHAIEKSSQEKVLRDVSEHFDLDGPPERIEVYDNSHIAGTNMVGAMIVAGPDGFIKNAYRKFNIKKAAASDDYGMMREVLERRFKKALQAQEDENPAAKDWPDLVLIDGGKGQLSAAQEVLEDLGLWSTLNVVAIAKGADRNAGRETFFMKDRSVFTLPENDPALHYLQRLRDEAHRFAIGAHRARRQKQISSTPLDEVPGIGARRKKALLHHFGSAKAVAQAGVEDLAKVEGVSKALAEKIYEYFH